MLTSKDKQALKAKAHNLKPVIIIGSKGLSDAVIEETQRALKTHELIKVKIAGADKQARAAIIENLNKACDCESVQTIGSIVVVYKPRPLEE